MSTTKKPRADSVLKTLPEDRQLAIAEYARAKTLPETVKWLRADGIATSVTALSLFLSWYAQQQQLKRNESTVEVLLQKAMTARPDWTPDQVQQAGQAFFSALALEQQDAKTWFLTQQLGLKKEQLGLDRQKFQRDTTELFLKWFADKRAKEIAAGTATNSDKINKLGELMFGEDWK